VVVQYLCDKVSFLCNHLRKCYVCLGEEFHSEDLWFSNMTVFYIWFNIDMRDILRLRVSTTPPTPTSLLPQYPGCSSSYLHLSLVHKLHGRHNCETFFSKPLTKDTKFQLCTIHLSLWDKKRLWNWNILQELTSVGLNILYTILFCTDLYSFKSWTDILLVELIISTS